MATDIERLVVALEASTTKYEKAMARANAVTNQRARQMETRFAKMNSTVSATFAATAKSFAVGFVGAFSLAQIGGAATAAVSAVGDLADAAARAGASAEKLQVLRGALEQNGGAAEDADAALKTLNVRLGQFVNTGAGPAAKAIKDLGVNLLDSAGNAVSNDEAFRRIIGRISEIEDPARRAAYAAAFFGKEAGPNMAGVLAIGVKGLDDIEKHMRSTSQVMSNDMVASGDRLDDRFAEYTRTWGTVFRGAVVLLADDIYNLADSFRSLENQTSAKNLSGDLETMMSQWAELQQQLVAVKKMAAEAPAGIAQAGLSQGVKDLEAQITELEKRMNAVNDRILTLRKPLPRPVYGSSSTEEGDGPSSTDDDPAKKIADIVPAAAAAESSVDGLNDTLQRSADMATSFATNFVSDLQGGVSATEALAGALDDLARQLIDMALNKAITSLFSNLLGAVGGSAGSVVGGIPRPGVNPFIGAAGGGSISGPGTGTSDSVPAMLSDGEYVIRASAAKKNRALLEAINSGFRIPKFAAGGMVGRSGGGRGPMVAATVEIHNHTDGKSNIRSETKQDADGGMRIDNFIDEVVGAKMQQRGSKTDRALRSNRGIGSQLTSR